MTKKSYDNVIRHGEVGNITQIGIIVRDLEGSMDNYIQTLNLKHWDVYTLSSEKLSSGSGIKSFTWHGEEVENFEFHLALSMLGTLQFELIQPVHNARIYEKFLEEKGEGIHHIKRKVEKDNLEDMVETFKEKGIEQIGHGEIDDDIFIYLDTTEQLGVVLELGNNGDMQPPDKRYP